jgi:hypothetical protein
MTPLPAWARRDAREICDHVIEDKSSAPRDVLIARKAEKLKAWLAPRTKNEKQKDTQKRKLQGAAARRTASAELRRTVVERAGGICELRWYCLYAPGTELHHLEGGSGRRQQKQAVSNCVLACMPCHRGYHKTPQEFFPSIKQWAERWGYPLPSIIRKAEASAQLPGRAAR